MTNLRRMIPEIEDNEDKISFLLLEEKKILSIEKINYNLMRVTRQLLLERCFLAEDVILLSMPHKVTLALYICKLMEVPTATLQCLPKVFSTANNQDKTPFTVYFLTAVFLFFY